MSIFSEKLFVEYMVRTYHVDPKLLQLPGRTPLKTRDQPEDLLLSLRMEKRQAQMHLASPGLAYHAGPSPGTFDGISRDLQPRYLQFSASPKIQKEQIEYFKYPFIMIEDASQKCKPMIKEFKPLKGSTDSSFPVFYLNSGVGHCPFINPIHYQSLNEKKQAPFPEHPKTEDEVEAYLKYRLQHKIKYVKVKKPGYCECCHEKYDDLEDHCAGKKHRDFATNPANYAKLDEFITANFPSLKGPAEVGLPKSGPRPKKYESALEAGTEHLGSCNPKESEAIDNPKGIVCSTPPSKVRLKELNSRAPLFESVSSCKTLLSTKRCLEESRQTKERLKRFLLENTKTNDSPDKESDRDDSLNAPTSPLKRFGKRTAACLNGMTVNSDEDLLGDPKIFETSIFIEEEQTTPKNPHDKEASTAVDKDPNHLMSEEVVNVPIALNSPQEHSVLSVLDQSGCHRTCGLEEIPLASKRRTVPIIELTPAKSGQKIPRLSKKVEKQITRYQDENKENLEGISNDWDFDPTEQPASKIVLQTLSPSACRRNLRPRK